MAAPLRKEANEPYRQRGTGHRGAPAKEVSQVRARQGVALGEVRYVLAISLALVIVAFAIIYFLYF